MNIFSFSQWSYKLLGIPNLLGKIKLKCLFHGPKWLSRTWCYSKRKFRHSIGISILILSCRPFRPKKLHAPIYLVNTSMLYSLQLSLYSEHLSHRIHKWFRSSNIPQILSQPIQKKGKEREPPLRPLPLAAAGCRLHQSKWRPAAAGGSIEYFSYSLIQKIYCMPASCYSYQRFLHWFLH